MSFNTNIVKGYMKAQVVSWSWGVTLATMGLIRLVYELGWHDAILGILSGIAFLLLIYSVCISFFRRKNLSFEIKEDWRDLNKFRIVGPAHGCRVQVKCGGTWVEIRSPKRYGPLRFKSEYDAQEFISIQREERKRELEELEARRKQEEKERELYNQVRGVFKV